VPLPGARNIRTLSARYIADLQEDWELHGKEALATYYSLLIGSLKLAGRPSNSTFRWIRFPRWVGVRCPNTDEPALDTLYRSVDHACWKDLGRRHGHRGLAAEPWPRTV
jgi:hypothetical protein